MKKDKVLIIATNDLGKSGVPEVIMQIVRLMHNNFDFDVIITRQNLYYKDEFESYGGKVYFFNEKEYRNRILRIAYKFFVKRFLLKKFVKPILAHNYKIIHSFKDLEGGFFLKLARKKGVPLRLSHCSRQYSKPKKLSSRIYDHFLLRSIYKNSTTLVAISKASGESLFGKKHPFKILYNTFNEGLYSYTEVPPSNKLTLTQIGTFLPIKNQLFSLQILSIIKKNLPDVTLFLIGRIYDKNYFNQILSYINLNNLSNNVIILDFDANQTEILYKTTFSLIPSIKEGLSLTAIESQAMGIKCFASVGVPEEVSCGNIEFNILDQNVWAEKILNEFKSTKGKRKAGNMSRFSNKSFIQTLKNLYQL